MNANPQAILVCNSKIRVAADRMGQLYNYFKALQAEAQAEGWVAMFPPDAEVINDGATVDGRTVITNTDVNNFIAMAGSFLTYMEQTGNANRNLALKIATNPERI